jgi:formate/nitrite transporter FocA (FNT family)
MASLERKKQEEIYDRTAPPGEVVYEAIKNEGVHELGRSSSALAWSGLAAGLSMGFSFIAQGLLHSHLPEAPWRPLISNFGYTVGFLMVILGRQQLFTENTLTPILPLLQGKVRKLLPNVLRLWTIVLATNMVGTMIFAVVVAKFDVVTPEVKTSLLEIGRNLMKLSFGTMMLKAVFAGWLIALMVWLLPAAESARIWIIIIISYLVGVGGFPHIIAGTTETFYLVAAGGTSLGEFFGGFALPTLVGNILGGVPLVAALAHAQFMMEQRR